MKMGGVMENELRMKKMGKTNLNSNMGIIR